MCFASAISKMKKNKTKKQKTISHIFKKKLDSKKIIMGDSNISTLLP